MSWYDAFSSFYDASLEALYAEHRVLAADALALEPGMTVLDLPCGTGQSFPAIAQRLRGSGMIIGGDLSAGMLRKAAAREGALSGVRLVMEALDVNALTLEALQAATGVGQVHRLHVFLGMSVFSDMEAAFDRLWSVLAPTGLPGEPDRPRRHPQVLLGAAAGAREGLRAARLALSPPARRPDQARDRAEALGPVFVTRHASRGNALSARRAGHPIARIRLLHRPNRSKHPTISGSG